jgi:HD-like signal output (HDOD) protein
MAVMKETLLLVELETQELCVDLRAVSNLILSDLGATLQVLRLAGSEYGDNESRPLRMEDCIADLGTHACIDAMSAHPMPRDLRSPPVTGLWRHSREIAGYSRYLAEQTMDVDPDEAYFVGLCHSIGLLPSVMGVDCTTCRELDVLRLGLELAKEWLLPRCVVGYFSDLNERGGGSAWVEIVQAAHRCAGGPTGEYASGRDLQPQLTWAV